MPRASAAPAILDAARACLIAGRGAFEMKEVALRAGVSEGLAYHYFKSKAGLVEAVVDEFYARYAEIANAPTDGAEDWAVREERRLRAVVRFLYEDPMARIVLAGPNRLPEAATAEARNRADIAERSVRNVRSGQRQGAIPSSVEASVAGPASIGALDQAVLHALTQDPVPEQERVADELWRIVRAIMGMTG